ncbi:MAG: hypothetical protein ACYTFG_20015 [Planctomycetota bacterium]
MSAGITRYEGGRRKFYFIGCHPLPYAILTISALAAIVVIFLPGDEISHENGGALESRNVPETAGFTEVDPSKVPFGSPGPGYKGLQARVFSRRIEHFAGRPIEVEVEIRNFGDEDRNSREVPHVLFRNAQFDVRDALGNPVPPIVLGTQYYATDRVLRPGETWKLGRGDLARSFYLYEPGLYSVRFPGSPEPREEGRDFPPVSNRFTFRVLPPEAANPVLEIVGQVLEAKPDDWDLFVSGILEDDFYERSMAGEGELDLWKHTGVIGDPKGTVTLYVNSPDERGELLCLRGDSRITFTANELAARKWPAFEEDLRRSLGRR